MRSSMYRLHPRITPKGFVGKRPRTSARLTRAGRAAFELHVAALQDIVARSGATIVPR